MKALVLFSGGLDSSTCLALAIEQHGKENVIALSIFYGQKHIKELEAAKNIVKHYGVEHITIDLAKIFAYSDSALLEHSKEEIPKGDYGKQLKEADGAQVSTYVPFRNGLFLSTAASLAISKKCDIIYYGAHNDDTDGIAYPDCSEGFYYAINTAIYLGSGRQIKVEAPFVTWTKTDVVKKGLELNVPYQLTWSCYSGQEKPCKVCGTCIDRRIAFETNGRRDPAL